ncbi:MAG: PorP/SprF family type IX secretion system membrane protein [Chitinophagales bacterium]|nr:PorP/SprF family type IX secretion system membrane protein [Chitinophagales bacterium]
MIHKVSSLRYMLIATIIMVLLQNTNAQDPHFSQFYTSPLTMNPAAAGMYTGTFRISTVYRDQWRSALDNPLRTFSASGDVKFDVKYNKNSQPDFVALGITFFGDRVSTYDYNTNQIVLTTAYHRLLDAKTKQYLGIGFQGGIMQKSVNYEDLTFQDQYNAVDGYTFGTAENLPVNNRAFADLSIGLYYTVSPVKDLNFNAGLGYFHFNKPNLSFYNSEDVIDPNTVKTDILHPKWSGHVSASIRTGDFLQVQPRANVLIQGAHAEINLGSNFRYKISKTSGQYLHLGAHLRGVNNIDRPGLESVILMAGFELSNFILGFSYDQGVRHLLVTRRSLSSMEFSIIYIGEHNNEDNFCPQF